jgi:hypothetical protein
MVFSMRGFVVGAFVPVVRELTIDSLRAIVNSQHNPARRFAKRASARAPAQPAFGDPRDFAVGRRADLLSAARGAHVAGESPRGRQRRPRWPARARNRTPLLELDGAAGYMRRSDRVAVTLARRMPRAMRLAGQLTSRGTSPA